MHKTEKVALIIAGLLFLGIVITGAFVLNTPTESVTSFDECEKAGNPVMESHPRQCRAKSGQTFIEILPDESPHVLPTTPPTSSSKPTASPNQPITIKSYSGITISFSYPSNWDPTNQPLTPGTVKEVINLGIPDSTDHTISFTPLNLEQLKPNDLQEESDITIGDHQGKKWIRHGEGYFSYDYYTKDPSSDGSFGVHVTTSERDSALEKQLDTMVKTIKFK